MNNNKPQRFNINQMEKVGVKVLDSDRILLECEKCGQKWSPSLLSGARLPKNYWRCPNGCNK